MRSVQITLPDGAMREYEGTTTAAQVAADISPGLAKSAIAARVDGVLSDLSLPIEKDAKVEILTGKPKSDRDRADALELVRHDYAHIMARAVQELWPQTKVTIGPVVENGFYYDFDREEPFTPDDLAVIEKKMREIIQANDPVRREVWDRERAIAHFKSTNEPYKVELVEAIPEGQDLRFYWHGHWQDLCRGPHLARTGQVPLDAFKLDRVAGAYWRGDSRNKMLQRIYGLAFLTKADLDAFLHQREEAEKRDHRKIGKEMDLFHFQEEAPGMVFWHAKGWSIWRALEAYMRRRLDANGYQEVRTPQLVDRKLWEASGHWEKFRKSMFLAEVEEVDEDGKSLDLKRVNALKPMNCPCHIQIFNQGLKSYRDLPLRMAEFGSCHRYEPSGSLHGVMRVRGFTQDDAHIFCEESQIQEETRRFIELLASVYRDLGFEKFRVKFSDRPETRAGTDATWDRAETALMEATKAAGWDFELNKGEGAFYGPKLEFVLTDAIGRDWQCGTLQVDYVMPERLNAEYVGEDGLRRRPVMLHRAILGSFERFLGILIEQYAGRMPLWLAPTQAVVATVVSDADDYAAEVGDLLRKAGLRAEVDARNEKINYKVREHSVGRTPLILVVGRKEAAERTIALRRLGSEKQEVLSLDEALKLLAAEALAPDLARQATGSAAPRDAELVS